MKFFTQFDSKKLAGLVCGKSRTKQAFKSECDINNILKKYATTGVLPDMIKQNPQYGDFSNVEEYQTSMNIVIRANDQFNALSSELRDRFQNDPSKFLEFCDNPQNSEELVKLGLAIPKKIEQTVNNDAPVIQTEVKNEK